MTTTEKQPTYPETRKTNNGFSINENQKQGIRITVAEAFTIWEELGQLLNDHIADTNRRVSEARRMTAEMQL